MKLSSADRAVLMRPEDGGLRDQTLIDAECLEMLERGYELKPLTVEAYREGLGGDRDGFDERLDALVAAGLVSRLGQILDLESPYDVFVALGRSLEYRMGADPSGTTSLIAVLPRLIQAWDRCDVGAPDDHVIETEIVHDFADRGTSWFDWLGDTSPACPALVFPEPDALMAALAGGHLLRLQRRVDATAVRVLVGARIKRNSRVQAQVETARAAGVEFRTSWHLDSWMYVDVGAGVVGVPARWGDRTSETAIAIRASSVVAGTMALFERLWESADRWQRAEPEWTSTVQLLARGLTDDDIARSLEVTVRVVRRHIAEAMRDVGVSTRFALGVEWQARRLGESVSPPISRARRIQSSPRSA
jgi:hypothetical protein